MIQRSDDGGKTWEPVGNKFAYDGEPGTHQWYDGTPAPVGVQARLASRAVADRSGHGVRRRRGRGAVSHAPTAGRPGRNCRRCAARRVRPVAARRRRHGPAHDPARSAPTRSASSSPSRRRARFAPTMAARPGSRSTAACAPSTIPDPDAEVGHCVHRIAMHPSRPDVLFMQKHWDVMRSDDAGEHVARGQRQPADRLRLPHRCARARAGDDLRGADQERLGALSARRQAARLSQPHGRQRMGGADQGAAAERLLRERAARRDGGRLAGRLRRLLRHDRRAGVRLAPTPATPGRRSCATCRRCCRSRCRRCHDPRRDCRRTCGPWPGSTARWSSRSRVP